MVIGTAGCSNSSRGWGNPWHFYMGLKYHANVISSSSSGAGNEMNIEKIRYIIEKNKVDLFVCQLTQPSRLVIGLENDGIIDGDFNNDGLHSNHTFKKTHYYTINAHDNNRNLNRIYGELFDIDKFILNKSITSKYNNDIKIFHTMMSIQYLCDLYGVRLIFFSWFVDIDKLSIKNGFEKITSKMNLIPGNVEDYARSNDIIPIPNDGHFDSESHQKIFEGFLNPYILPHVKELTKII